jgi:hypothetical protein
LKLNGCMHPLRNLTVRALVKVVHLILIAISKPAKYKEKLTSVIDALSFFSVM